MARMSREMQSRMKENVLREFRKNPVYKAVAAKLGIGERTVRNIVLRESKAAEMPMSFSGSAREVTLGPALTGHGINAKTKAEDNFASQTSKAQSQDTTPRSISSDTLTGHKSYLETSKEPTILSDGTSSAKRDLPAETNNDIIKKICRMHNEGQGRTQIIAEVGYLDLVDETLKKLSGPDVREMTEIIIQVCGPREQEKEYYEELLKAGFIPGEDLYKIIEDYVERERNMEQEFTLLRVWRDDVELPTGLVYYRCAICNKPMAIINLKDDAGFSIISDLGRRVHLKCARNGNEGPIASRV